jgi:hypothetical protein
MSGFVQLVEFTTSRFEEMERLNEEWRRLNPDRGYEWMVMTADRDQPGRYVAVVEFSSYEEAMRNSEDPRTGDFAAKMAALSDAPPVFRNLDVVRTEGSGGSGA